MNFVLLALFAYFVGAFPIGYIIARLRGVRDIRKYGSGNIGATNVARLFGIHYFFLIFILDAGKAYLFTSIIPGSCSVQQLYFLLTILLFGNSCSVFLRGSGGKGVATMFGILCALRPIVCVTVFVVWLLCLLLTRTVGIASLFAVAAIPLYAYFILHDVSFFAWSVILFFWILFLHRKNVRAYF